MGSFEHLNVSFICTNCMKTFVERDLDNSVIYELIMKFSFLTNMTELKSTEENQLFSMTHLRSQT